MVYRARIIYCENIDVCTRGRYVFEITFSFPTDAFCFQFDEQFGTREREMQQIVIIALSRNSRVERIACVNDFVI